MASGLLIKQKQLLAGDGIAINHGENASTISLAENALDNAVRIYDATVDAETGVITITDGTQVADLAIGDEIRTPDGVYQKIKDSITTGSPADGTRIEVSGITSPAEANGLYILTETANVWKHESADYWISQWSGSYWLIANSSSPTDPSMALFYASGSSSSMPWEMSNWTRTVYGTGSPSLVNASTEEHIYNTLALFEYASLPVEPENIVQSVNGTKPDASGNVTIETSSGGLTSVATGDGLTGDGTSEDPVKLDLSNYSTTEQISLSSSQSELASVEMISSYTDHSGGGANGESEQAQSWNNIFRLNADGARIESNVGITLHVPSLNKLVLRYGTTFSGAANQAHGLAVIDSSGKLPSSILPESTVDLSNYTGALNITATSNASIRGGTSGNYDVTIGDSSHGVTVYAAQNNPTVSITSFGSSGNIDLNSANINVGGSSGSTKITLKSSDVSVEPTTGGGTFSVDVTSSGSVKFTAGNIYFNNNASNTAGGFAIVGSDGKLPASIIPVSSNRHPFTSSDLSSNVLTITTTGNVTGVIDDSGKAWNFADEEVTYTDSTVSVDLSGVFARKGIATPTGTWKLMLYGA